ADTPNAVLANQYHNPMNPDSHYQTTGPEIWAQTGGKVTDIVVAMGTGGTVTGIARFMREQAVPIRLVGVDPIGSILHGAWEQHGSSEGLEAHPYKVEGIGEDFIPTTLDLNLLDDVIQVSDAEAFRWTRRLVREEGIFGGGSSGAALAGALRYARDLGPERLVVVILPDTGARYLSKVFNDDWMRENGFLEWDRERVTVQQVAQARGLPSLVVAAEADPMLEVIGRMRAHAVSQLPVVGEAGTLVGMVSEVDLLSHLVTAGHEHPPGETIRGIINRDVPTARAETPFQEILPELLSKKVAVLVDDAGKPVGILTMIDALEFLAATPAG
ncbi:MAG: pyridoxal-phosphate dependent enzyme, partial [Anaerolineales bacterium]